MATTNALNATRPEAFLKAWDEFRKDLTQSEQDEMACGNLIDLQKHILDLQKKTSRIVNMSRLAAFIEAMEQYGKVVEVFLNCTNILAFVWGPMKFILQIASTFSEAFEEILNMYSDIGECLPMFIQYEALFRDADFPHMREVLQLVYTDVMQFHCKAYKYFRQRMWKQLFQCHWKTFRSHFQPIFDNIRRHKKLIETQAGLYQFEEIQRIRLKADMEFQHMRDTEDLAKQSSLLDWLASASVQEDQDVRSNARLEYPGVCAWVNNNAKFKAWRDRDPTTSPMLWLTGIPGSGKSTVSSFIIEQLQQLPSSHVLYFYCKHKDAARDNFLGLARSLIGQAIQQNGILLPYVYEEFLNSGEKPLKTLKKAKEILEIALKSLNNIYIVLDGLDECSVNGKEIITWVKGRAQSALDDGIEFRCLFSCQNDDVTSKALRGIPTIQINTKRLQNDLKIYCGVEVDKIQAKFDLEDDECQDIVVKVTEEAQDMFLYAKLVMNNLLNQTRLSRLKNELKPGTFPRTLKQAYGRIIERLLDPQSGYKDDTRQLLNVLVCAKRSLKWHEIQGAVAIDVDENDVDFRGRSFRVDAKSLAGSLVEFQPSGAIELVHSTTRLYLIDEAHVCLKTEETNMAHLCLRYLSMDCFGSTVQKGDISRYVDSGYYSFSEYAIVHWSDHLITALSLDLEKKQLDQLAESTDSFLDRHFVQRQPIEWAPEETKVVLGTFSIRSFFIYLVQVIALLRLRRNPELIERRKGDLPECLENNLNLEDTLCKIRNKIEKAGFNDKMIEYYGSKRFRCDRIDCSSFHDGFLDPQAAKSHIKKHEYRWYCTVDGCPRENAFASDAKLCEHRGQFHSIKGNSTNFPSTYDWSDHCLKEAVRAVDITHLNKFYFEYLPAESKVEEPKPILANHIHNSQRSSSKVVWKEALEHMNDTMLNYLIKHTNFADGFAQRFILEKAAEAANTNAIRRFTGDNFRPEPRYSPTLLIWDRAIDVAIQRQDVHILAMLLEPTLRGPESSTRSYKDRLRDICVKVCRLGHLELVKYFVEVAGVTISGRFDKGPRPEADNPPGRGFGMLYHATEMGHDNILRYLFERMDSQEAQPLRIEEIELLLQTAAVNIYPATLILLSRQFHQVPTPTLIEYGQLLLVYLSFRFGGHVADSNDMSMIESLDSSKCDVPDRYGWTLLMYAAYSWDAKAVDTLIKKKASCYARGYSISEHFPHSALCHRTPFEIAWLTGHKESAKLLQQAHDPNKFESVVLRWRTWDIYSWPMDDRNLGILNTETTVEDQKDLVHKSKEVLNQLQIWISVCREQIDSGANAPNEGQKREYSAPAKQTSRRRGIKRLKPIPSREGKRRFKESNRSPSSAPSWLREGLLDASGDDADMSDSKLSNS